MAVDKVANLDWTCISKPIGQLDVTNAGIAIIGDNLQGLHHNQ